MTINYRETIGSSEAIQVACSTCKNNIYYTDRYTQAARDFAQQEAEAHDRLFHLKHSIYLTVALFGIRE